MHQSEYQWRGRRVLSPQERSPGLPSIPLRVYYMLKVLSTVLCEGESHGVFKGMKINYSHHQSHVSCSPTILWYLGWLVLATWRTPDIFLILTRASRGRWYILISHQFSSLTFSQIVWRKNLQVYLESNSWRRVKDTWVPLVCNTPIYIGQQISYREDAL